MPIILARELITMKDRIWSTFGFDRLCADKSKEISPEHVGGSGPVSF
jgi:hypothetical protein